MDGRYLTPLQLQAALVDTLFGAARTLNVCSQAMLTVQSAVWRNWRGLSTAGSSGTTANR